LSLLLLFAAAADPLNFSYDGPPEDWTYDQRPPQGDAPNQFSYDGPPTGFTYPS
jgi:hypothetical protein